MALKDEIAMIGEIDLTKHGTYLDAMIPVLIEFVEDYCNITIEKDSEGNYLLPAGVKIFISESIKHKLSSKGLNSRTMGTVSYSYDTNVPEKIKKFLRPYRKVRFK